MSCILAEIVYTIIKEKPRYKAKYLTSATRKRKEKLIMTGTAKIIPFPGQEEERVSLTKSELSKMLGEAARQAIELYASAPSSSEVLTVKSKPHHMTPEERRQKLSPYKSDGGKKATAATPIRDPAKIKGIRDFFLDRGQLREYAIFSVGLTLGIRASDLLTMKVGDFMNPDFTFKNRLDVIEMKTDKRNRPLLVDYAKNALKIYLASRGGDLDLQDYMFVTNRKLSDGRQAPLSLSLFNQNLSYAGSSVEMHLSSHCMRHTFALYMNLYGKSEMEGQLNYMSLLMTQMSMNHANLSQTLAYTGLSQDVMDEKRTALSQYLADNT